MTYSLNELLENIYSGKINSLNECLNCLSEKNLNQRQENIKKLLVAFNTTKKYHQANLLAELLWYLGVKTKEVYNYLIEYYQFQKDTNKALHLIREFAHIIFKKQDLFLFPELLRRYTSIRTEKYSLILEHNKIVGQPQDFILKRQLNSLVAPYRFQHNNKHYSNRKKRLGYVLWGDDQSNNIAEIILSITLLHDFSKYEIYLFTYFKHENLSPKLVNLKNQLQSKGAIFIYCAIALDTYGITTWESAYCLARQIYNENIDCLIFSSQYPEQMLLAELKPAPLMIGFTHGFPEGFTNHSLDYMIDQNIQKVSIEELTNSIFLNQATFFTTTEENTGIKISKSDLNIDQDNLVILTMGIHTKFNSPKTIDYFLMIKNILNQYQNVKWVIVGINANEINGGNYDPNILHKNMIFIEKCIDYEKYYNISDIYVDTFPKSGGITSFHSLIKKIPTIIYKHSLDKYWLFQTNTGYDSFGEMLSDDIVVSGSLSKIYDRIVALIESAELRELYANKAFNQIIQFQNVDLYIRKLETIYEQCFFEKLHNDQKLETPSYYVLHSKKINKQLEQIKKISSTDFQKSINLCEEILRLDITNKEVYKYIFDICQQHYTYSFDHLVNYLIKYIVFCDIFFRDIENLFTNLYKHNNIQHVLYFSSLYYNLNKNKISEINELQKFLNKFQFN